MPWKMCRTPVEARACVRNFLGVEILLLGNSGNSPDELSVHRVEIRELSEACGWWPGGWPGRVECRDGGAVQQLGLAFAAGIEKKKRHDFSNTGFGGQRTWNNTVLYKVVLKSNVPLTFRKAKGNNKIVLGSFHFGGFWFLGVK
ncbi:hypothetical protein L484_001150 [Morus notabilis]|uniref:Uncharacterized protein n=1 Tax=Morus notabilis TaxID=981085 RepID=W9R7B2_9ROSA|nr:hypothetical protein L484_001150 [Morus notabilis]